MNSRFGQEAGQTEVFAAVLQRAERKVGHFMPFGGFGAFLFLPSSGVQAFIGTTSLQNLTEQRLIPQIPPRGSLGRNWLEELVAEIDPVRHWLGCAVRPCLP